MHNISFKKAILTIILIVPAMAGSVSLAQTPAQTPGPRLSEADSLFAHKAWSLARARYLSILGDKVAIAAAWYRLGFCDQNLGKDEEAMRDYRQALQLHPSPPLKTVIYSKMARIHSSRHQNIPALDDLDSAVANGYLNLPELDTAKDFARLRAEKRFCDIRQKVYASVYPCMSDPHAREFDFWVGEWDVYVTGTWNYAGHSLIQRIAGGCSLLENWDSPASSGKSINFIDPVKNTWKQSWSGSYKNGNQEFTDGVYKDDAMRFSFMTTDAASNKITGRLIFYNLGKDRVRQLSESFVDSAKTWTTNYDFTYIRKKS